MPQLPKDALVEWQFAVHTGRRVTPVLNDDEEDPVVSRHQCCKCLLVVSDLLLTHMLQTKTKVTMAQ